MSTLSDKEEDAEEEEDDKSSHMLLGVPSAIEKVCILLNVIYHFAVKVQLTDNSSFKKLSLLFNQVLNSAKHG